MFYELTVGKDVKIEARNWNDGEYTAPNEVILVYTCTKSPVTNVKSSE